MSASVRVDLGQRAYDIQIGGGILGQAGALIAPLARRKRIPVVSDANVSRLHGEALRQAFAKSGLEADFIVLPAGEAMKSFAGLEKLTDELLAREVERGDAIVAFGGGTVGDLTGFAAGVLKRGIDYVQIPTTLLAQVDSAVGGKTAINVARGKNLVGLFHQPRLVISDVSVLSTLPKRELLSGYAEVVKCALIADAGFFEWLETNGQRALAGDAALMSEIVRRCCEMKARIVAEDEREAGARMKLNFGHTFGHALEAAAGYSERLKHGEAVSIGMCLAFALSEKLGLCRNEDARRAREHLKSIGLPVAIVEIPGVKPDARAILTAIKQDKKAREGKPQLVLTRGIGKAFVTSDAGFEQIASVLV